MQLSSDPRLKYRRRQITIYKLLLTSFFALILTVYFLLRRELNPVDSEFAERYEAKSRHFANISNETGSTNGELIVPNIIHFIVFETNITFTHFICILAALKNQRPEKIYFHTTHHTFHGQYWSRLMSLQQFPDILEVKRVEIPIDFDQDIFAGYDIWHACNIIRIRTLIEYGGIYLDNDMYILKSLDFYRKFELAISYVENVFLGNQLIIAHKDARFLELWLHIYDTPYNISKDYYKEGELPTTPAIRNYTEMVHRFKLEFGNKTNFATSLFEEFWQYLLHNVWEEAYYPADFDEYNLHKYPIMFQEMANEALDYEKSQRLKQIDFNFTEKL